METLKLIKQSIKHPLEFFYDIQFNGRAKLRDALLIVFVAICIRIMNLMFTGFSFSMLEPYQVSIPIEIGYIIVPWVTWAIANWGVGAIVDGEGKFKDILISSAFGFVPYILMSFPMTILSNLLTQKEGGIYSTYMMFMTLWVIFMFIMQVKVIHDFELGKTLWVTLLTVFGMLIIWFVIIMIFGLINQSITFVTDIFKEISYRT